MFDNLTAKLEGVFKKLKGHGKLTQQNIQEALKEVRMALLEADVNFKVVKDFIQSVEQRAIGQEVLAKGGPALTTPLLPLIVSSLSLSCDQPQPLAPRAREVMSHKRIIRPSFQTNRYRMVIASSCLYTTV